MPLSPRRTLTLVALALMLFPISTVHAQRRGNNPEFDREAPQIGEPLPDVTVFDADGNELSLRSIKDNYSVIVFGCLTWPPFIRNVPSLETVHRDYSPKGVGFYYIYKQLAHPETNSYVDPVNLKERLAHVRAASESLKTEFHWICDNMSNDLKHMMGNRPNSEFVIDPEGKVVIRRAWSDPEQLREDLAKLVGKSETVTTVAELGYQIDPQPKQAARGVVERIDVPGGMTALKSTLVSSSEGENYFVKLRAEADRELMDGGSGKLYIAFHVDPIYQVHWNNDTSPLEYELELPKGIRAEQSQGSGPQVDVSADVDPREFLIDLSIDDRVDEPIQITARFMICDDAETFCIPVTEVFQVYLERDPDLGRRMSGSRDRARRPGQGNRTGGMARMMQRDTDGDGKLSKQELPQSMRTRFEQFDSNEDGYLDRTELQRMANRRGGRRDR